MTAGRRSGQADVRWILRERGAGKAVLLIPSLWGLHPGVEAIGQRLAREGFDVAIPDLLGGRRPATLGEALSLRARHQGAAALPLLHRTCQGLIDWSGCGTLGVVGLSLGAHWAVRLSQEGDLPIAAAVLLYGARSGDFSESHADYQCHFAGHSDPYLPAAARPRMLKAISEAGRPVQVFEYPRCGHWFAEKGVQDCYSPYSARLALDRTARFLGGMAPLVGERLPALDGMLQASP